jgi:hypothetical protein
MIPSLFYYTDGKSLMEIVKFIMGTEPYMLGTPVLKSFLYFVSAYLGPRPSNFILVLLVFHLSNSALVYLLARQLKFGERVGLVAALVYLALYSHYDSYIWLANFQHTAVAFFILLVFNLYLWTDESISSAKPYAGRWLLTICVNLLATLSRASIAILPLVVLSHILLQPEGGERKRKYRIWLPLFFSYLLYPLLTLTYVGDDQIKVLLNLGLSSPIANYLVLLSLGTACLFLLDRGLVLYSRFGGRRLRNSLLLLSGIAIYVFAVRSDIRNLFLPYNVMVPYLTLLNSLVSPLEGVLLMQSPDWDNHHIHSQISPFSFILGIVFLVIFYRKFVSGQRQQLALLAWYFVPLFYLNLYHNVLSRYLVYISPIFSIVASSALLYLYDRFTERMTLKRIWKEAVLAVLLVSLLVPNIMAIKLRVFRIKLPNTYYTYDYIMVANLVVEALKNNDGTGATGPLHISGLVQMPFDAMWSFSPVDPGDYLNFRLIMAQVLNDPDIYKYRLNEDFSGGGRRFTQELDRVLDEDGRDINVFNTHLDNGEREFRAGNYEAALSYFERAVAARPFLVNYMLGGYGLEDLRWITNGGDLITWTNKMGNLMSFGDLKSRHVSMIFSEEILKYVKSLFYASYLNFRLGNEKASTELFSMVPYIVSDHEKVFYMLSGVPEISSNDEAMSFLRDYCDPAYYVPSLWSKPRRDRFPTDFQLFIARFASGGVLDEAIRNRYAEHRERRLGEKEKVHAMPREL